MSKAWIVQWFASLTARASPGSRRLVDVASLALANLFRAGLGLVASAIVFRALGPQDIGRMTTALSIVGFTSIIAEFGLRDAAVNFIAQSLSSGSHQSERIARTFLVSKTFLATVATGVALSTASLIAARFYPLAQVDALIRLAAFSLLADGLLGYSLAILEARQSFTALSLLNAFQSALRFAAILALFFLKQVNLVTLLLLESVIPLAAFLYSARFIPSAYLTLRRPFLEFLSQLFHFSKWIAVAAFASLLAARLDVLYLSHYQVPAVVGLYAAALALVNKIDLIKIPILTTAFPAACRLSQPHDLRRYVLQNLKLTLLISLSLLPLFILGKYLLVILYGHEFSQGALAFNLLLAAYLISFNAEPAAFVLYPLDKPAWVAGKELIPLIFFTGIGAVLIARFGIQGAAWSVLIKKTLEALLTCLLVWQFLWKPAAVRTKRLYT
jgi:O-antigen/teichoic acid export membrane protein